MAEVEIETILKALKGVASSHIKDMHIRYDEEADTLYLNFGAPVPADDSELSEDNILYRYRGGELVGITATHFSER